MEMSALLAFTAVAATLIMVPGPDWALLVGVSSRRGPVAPSIVGLALGYAVITTAVVAGVAPLVAAEPTALLVLSMVGAAYLLHVGVGMLRSPVAADIPIDAGAPATGSVGRAVRQGLGVSTLNPKALLFFLAFLPQFANPGAPWPFAIQLAVLGTTWILLASGFYAVLGYTARRSLHRRPGLTLVLTRLSGVAMVVAGIALPIEQLIRHTPG
ncbi:LysE family translocator [Pseudonocardia sp.]|uniref:LysE family translocator n=1 Tax=Pseudonocardia sp. TaxID=60912 RepID=UPI003D0F1F70